MRVARSSSFPRLQGRQQSHVTHHAIIPPPSAFHLHFLFPQDRVMSNISLSVKRRVHRERVVIYAMRDAHLNDCDVT